MPSLEKGCKIKLIMLYYRARVSVLQRHTATQKFTENPPAPLPFFRLHTKLSKLSLGHFNQREHSIHYKGNHVSTCQFLFFHSRSNVQQQEQKKKSREKKIIEITNHYFIRRSTKYISKLYSWPCRDSEKSRI